MISLDGVVAILLGWAVVAVVSVWSRAVLWAVALAHGRMQWRREWRRYGWTAEDAAVHWRVWRGLIDLRC